MLLCHSPFSLDSSALNFCTFISSLNQGTAGLLATVLVISGACRSKADRNVLLEHLTRLFSLNERSLLQRSELENSYLNASVSIALIFLKDILDFLVEGLNSCIVQ